ncbi:MAG: hypothetical protein ACTSQJ_01535 [Promethearchaeota archaeon]
MSFNRIEDMPSQLIDHRIKEGWQVYNQACQAFKRSASGSPAKPKSWATFPQVEQLVQAMRYGYEVLKQRKKAIEKAIKEERERRKRKEEKKRNKRRLVQMERLIERKETMSITEAMKRLEFDNRELCIEYLIDAPYDIIISGSEIYVGHNPHKGYKELKENIVWDPWKTEEIKEKINFKDLLPISDNEFVNKIWKNAKQLVEKKMEKDNKILNEWQEKLKNEIEILKEKLSLTNQIDMDAIEPLISQIEKQWKKIKDLRNTGMLGFIKLQNSLKILKSFLLYLKNNQPWLFGVIKEKVWSDDVRVFNLLDKTEDNIYEIIYQLG